MQEGAPAAPQAAAEGGPAWKIDGSLAARYRARWIPHPNQGPFESSEADHDAFGYLRLDGGDPTTHKVSAHFYGRVWLDAHRSRSRSRWGYYAFDDIEDAFARRSNRRLYYGYIDFNRLGVLERFRIGRQDLYETPEYLYFDGARMDFRLGRVERLFKRLDFSVYGGLPVRRFETDRPLDALLASGRNGELSLLGAAAATPLWRGAKVRFDWTHVTDQVFMGIWRHRRQSDLTNLFGVNLTQRVTDTLSLYGRYTFLGQTELKRTENRDARLRLAFTQPKWDFRVEASSYWLLRRQRDFPLEFETFFPAGGFLEPYWLGSLLLWKGISPHFSMQGGLDYRQVREDRRRGLFNRDYTRWYFTPILAGWPHARLTISATVEYWFSTQRRVRTWGAAVGYQATDSIHLTAGSNYTLWRYDYLRAREREDVRIHYAEAKLKCPQKRWSGTARYAFENDSRLRYHVVQLGIEYAF